MGDVLIKETQNHAVKSKTAVSALGDIDNIIKNAVLFDTSISEKTSKTKLQNTAFMHSLYSIYEKGNAKYLLKLYVEEALPNKGGEAFSRAYELKDIKEIATIPDGVLSENGGLTDDTMTVSIDSISALFDIVKTYDKEFNPRPANPLFLNENGTPRVMYHQTSKDFTVFNTNNERAGKHDSDTPTGIFLKPTSEDIGIDGKKQIAVYLNARNVLEFSNREQIHKYWMKNVDEYAELQKQYNDIDKHYSEVYEEAEAKGDAWYEANYNDLVSGKISDEEAIKIMDEPLSTILDEWKSKTNPIRRKQKVLITNYMRQSDYDGIHLIADGKSNGVMVESYIVFEPNQIRN